jgi:MoaA/NifB/PqqE/SkfB family radical SAM enzyme
MEVLRSCVVQVSGGEPLMREDVVEIVRNITAGATIPYLILVSNWTNMSEEKYLALHEAGVDQFSVSLDFPDARHDTFRGYPGLYSQLESLVPKLAAHGFDDIVLNSCITSQNVGEINRLADKAREWGVNICFSSYSAKRTGCREYSLRTLAQLERLHRELDGVEKRRDGTNWIVNAPSTIAATREFFERGGMPGCRAGHRFLVVTSDGFLQPCSMVFKRWRLEDYANIAREFTDSNSCGECYVSIRSYLDKSFPRLLWENVSGFLAVR